jgi:zinc protease
MSPVDRARPPLAGEVRDVRFPAFERARLANGLELYLARWPALPLVNLQLLMPAGARLDPPGAAGLASLHGGLLDEGTDRRTALDVASFIERLGGYLGTGADWDVAYLGATVLSAHLEAALELFADLARSSCFRAAEVDRARRHRLAEILRRKGQPAALADRFFSRVVYAGTVYAEPLIGTEESVRKLGRGDFESFFRRHASPSGGALLAVGDVDPATLARRAGEVFGDWQGAAAEPPAPVAPPPLDGLEIHVVDRPGSAQTQLQLGHLGIARNHPDQPEALLANVVLGGNFTSRLNLNLREKHGVTYGAHSQFVYRRESGPLVIRLAVATEAAAKAVREIVAEMRRLHEELVTAKELRETQDFLVGAFPTTLQTVSDLARRLETLAVFGMPDDYYQSFPALLRGLTAEGVRAAARRYLHPDGMAVVAVGPAAELRRQLEPVGPVTVHTP